MTTDTNSLDLARARLCVIMNLGSGRKDGAAVRRALHERLAPLCAEFELRETEKGGDLVAMGRQAIADGFDVIAACGGDGTQSAIAGVLTGSDRVMMVLPGGTFNYFARDLGVGETIDEALDRVAGATPRPIDVGDINGLIFLNNISLGAYPHILKTRERIYKRWGRSRIAAYWSVIKALRQLNRPMTVETLVGAERQRFTTALIFVARSAYQMESFGLDGADAVRQGRFAVLIARARQPLPLMRSAFRLAFGLSAKDSDFDLIEADDLTISTDRTRPLLAHDGEKTRMEGPFHLKVRHGGLRVLCPEAPRPEGAPE